jgi:hypothetical protein
MALFQRFCFPDGRREEPALGGVNSKKPRPGVILQNPLHEFFVPGFLNQGHCGAAKTGPGETRAYRSVVQLSFYQLV